MPQYMVYIIPPHAYHQGPIFPNSTASTLPKGGKGKGDSISCPAGCLFHLETDETESVDLRAREPARFAALVARLRSVGSTTRVTDYTDAPFSSCMADREVFEYWKGYSGPVCIQNRTTGGGLAGSEEATEVAVMGEAIVR